MGVLTLHCKYPAHQVSFASHGGTPFHVDVARMYPRGITLFELLIVLVVLGIVAAFALPAYRQHMLRVNRTEAMTALLELQSAEETFYLRHGAFTASTEAAPPDGLGLVNTSNKYTVAVALAADGQSYIASATPTASGGQEADRECLAFSVDARGRRAVSGTADTQRCWK
jgi:type IV pilus assembly protein PilE